MYKSHFFKEDEFAACNPSCSMSQMNENLLIRLDVARHILGAPIELSSAYRTVDHEINKGRSGTSSHCKGFAVDLRCLDSPRFGSHYRLRLVRALLMAGFTRIGVYKNFVHADIDTLKPSCMWIDGKTDVNEKEEL